LKKSSIGILVTLEEFDNILSLRGAVIGKAGAFLTIGETEVFAFEVPSTEELGDVGVVEEGCSGLTRTRHDANRTNNSRCRSVVAGAS
jgi:hypothetical protein